MGADLISKKTRYEFRELLVGWVLREIEGAFDSADIECRSDYQPPVGGARRTLVEQYYASLDLTDAGDAARLLRAFEFVLNEELTPRTDTITGLPRPTSDAAKRLLHWLKKDGYDFVEGRLVPASRDARIAELRAAAQAMDAPHLAEHVRRIEAAINADPDAAIGSAKELLETTCKTVLSERGVTEDVDKLDLAPLVKRTAKELALIPESIPDSARGAEAVRRVLSSFANAAQGLAELRNLYGTGHGRDGKRRGLEARHARLAVGTATTIAMFLFDTHRARLAR